MNCEDFGKYLDNYENLTDNEKSGMSEHAAMCGKCQAELDFFLSMISAAKSLPKIDPPADFMDNLNARLDAEDKRVVSMPKLAYHFRQNRKQYAAAAACLALVTLITANRSALLDQFKTDDSGVIVEETVVSDNTDSESALPTPAGEATDNASEPAALPAAVHERENTSLARATASPAKRTVSAPAKATSAPVSYTPAPATYTQAPVSMPSEVVTNNSGLSLHSETETAPVSEPVKGRSVSRARSVKEDYGIALAGALSSDTETAAIYDLKADEVIASLKEYNDVQAAYSLVEGGGSIAYGRYYTLDRNGIPISSANAIGSIKIDSADAELAMEILNRYPVDENGNIYTTDSVNLTLILSQMRKEGVNFTNYTISGSGEVKFKVQFN